MQSHSYRNSLKYLSFIYAMDAYGGRRQVKDSDMNFFGGCSLGNQWERLHMPGKDMDRTLTLSDVSSGEQCFIKCISLAIDSFPGLPSCVANHHSDAIRTVWWLSGVSVIARLHSLHIVCVRAHPAEQFGISLSVTHILLLLYRTEIITDWNSVFSYTTDDGKLKVLVQFYANRTRCMTQATFYV